MITPDTELSPVLFTLFVAFLLVGCYVLAKLLIFVLTIDYRMLYDSFVDAVASFHNDVTDSINYFEDLNDE